MFLFPTQQQKSCCEKEDAAAACELYSAISVHDDGLLPAALRKKEGMPMHMRSFETIRMSLRWREGEISDDIVLKLLSLDFMCVYIAGRFEKRYACLTKR